MHAQDRDAIEFYTEKKIVVRDGLRSIRGSFKLSLHHLSVARWPGKQDSLEASRNGGIYCSLDQFGVLHQDFPAIH